MKFSLFLASMLVLPSALVLTSCASINSVSLTPIPAERKNQVKTEASKVIILGFNFDNDFVDAMIEDLQKQCPNGKVSGILTKDENINYFLYFVWKKQVTATGFCVTSNSAKTDKPKARGTASDDAAGTQTEEREL